MSETEKSNRLFLTFILGGLTVGIHNVLSGQTILNNSGISFGYSLNIYLIILGWVVLLIYLMKFWNWGLVMVAIGGLSNLIDRLVLGYVRDYWKVPTLNIVNNLNDWLIAVGVLFFLVSIWMKER